MKSETILKHMKSFALGALVILLNGASGEICSCEKVVTAFGRLYPDNNVQDVEKVLDRIKPQTAPSVENFTRDPIMVVTIQEENRSIAAVNLKTGEKMWRSNMVPRSRISTGKDVAVFLSGNNVTAIGLADGKMLWDWEVEEGWDYYGATVEDGVVYAVIGVGTLEEAEGYRNGRIVAIEALTGSEIWEHQTNGGLLGRPDAAYGMIFVPWDRQSLAVLDHVDGAEICRLRLGDDMINFVDVRDTGVYYGGSSLYRFTPRSVSGTRGESTVFAPDLEEAPGEPLFSTSAFSQAVGGRSALEKIRYLWSPGRDTSDATVNTSGGLFYFLYWRFVIAFNASDSTVRWTYKHVEDVEGAVALDSGVLLLGEKGGLVYVDAASGTQTWNMDTGLNVAAAAFDAAGFQPAAPAAPVQHNARLGLKKLVLDSDNRMLPIRQFAALLLGKSPDPEATRDLLDVYSTRNIPKPLRQSVVRALKGRRTGSEYLVNALKMRYDFLEQTQGPPMTVVAPALVQQNDRSAIPDLLSHVVNHETEPDDLMATVVALVKLGDASIIGTFRHMIVRYHADSAFFQHPEILRVMASGLLIHGDIAEREMLASIREDAQTNLKLKEHIDLLMSQPGIADDVALELAINGPKKEEEKEEQAAAPEPEEEVEQPAAPVEILPDELTNDQIRGIISANAARLKPCVNEALRSMPNLRNIRLLFQITGEDGRASNVEVLPARIELKACMAAQISQISFPRFKKQRMKATYMISISHTMPVEPTSPDYDPDAFGSTGGREQGGAQPQPKRPGQSGFGTSGWGKQPDKQ